MESTADAIVWSLTEDQCWNLLARGDVGHLAVIAEGKPDIFPVNYVIDGAHVLFRTAPGSKLADVALNPDVAFEVEQHDDTVAASVVIKGRAQRLELQSEIDAADALQLASWIPTLKYRWVRISATSITGRRFERGREPARYRASRPVRD